MEQIEACVCVCLHSVQWQFAKAEEEEEVKDYCLGEKSASLYVTQTPVTYS